VGQGEKTIEPLSHNGEGSDLKKQASRKRAFIQELNDKSWGAIRERNGQREGKAIGRVIGGPQIGVPRI